MSVWPKPVHLATGAEIVWLSRDLTYSYQTDDGHGDSDLSDIFAELTSISCPNPSENVDRQRPSSHGVDFGACFSEAKKTLLEEHFTPWKMHPRGHDFEPELASESANVIKEIRITEHKLRDRPHSVEAYRLSIDSNGHCRIDVVSVRGAIAAMSTLVQLFYTHSKDSKAVYCSSAPVVVQDQPRFHHRGLNLDICRNIINPQDVIRTIKGLWLAKINKLHLHATDSQSWPIQIPSMPELAEKGAYHESQIWHPQDLEEVQRCGQHLGIEVFIEIDLPGHTGSIYHSHPDLTLAYDKPWDKYAVEPPSGQLKLNSTKVHDFLRKLFDDLCPRLSKFTSHFHLGADELNTNCYTLEDGINSSDKAVLLPFMQRFFKVVFESLSKHQMRPIMWEDILLDYDLTFPEDTVFQVWRNHESLAKILDRGYCAIFGPADSWYLDVGLGTFLDPDPNNPDTPIKPPYHDWNPPFKNWRLIYSYNPFNGVPEKHHHKILGGEVSNWGELTDSVNLDAMLWPRVGAAAEILWAGPGKIGEEVTRRLAEFRERLVLKGIAAQVVQMEWILRNKGRGNW